MEEDLMVKREQASRTEAEEEIIRATADTAEGVRVKITAADRRMEEKEDTAAHLRDTARQKAEADGEGTQNKQISGQRKAFKEAFCE